MTRQRSLPIALLLSLVTSGCPQPGAAAPVTAGAPVAAGNLPTAAAPPASAERGAAARPEPQPAPDPEVPLTRVGSLEVLEVVLGDANPDASLPMIVAIHGLGDRPEDFARVFDGFAEPARLVLPRGIDLADEGGYSWFPTRARDPDVDGLSRGIARAADEIADAIAELRNERPTTGAPIVTGFSQGGMLAFAIAVRHPEVVGAAMPVGGWLPPPLVPASLREGTRYPPIDAYHGTDDRAVKYEPTVSAIDSLRTLGVSTSLHTYEGVGHAITPEIHRDLLTRITAAVRTAR